MSDNVVDLYAVLGIARGATPDEIKTAFRAKARSLHPDVAGEASKDAFQALQHAYAVLGDPQKRAIYDATGSDDDRAKMSDRQKAVGIINTMMGQIITQVPDVIYQDVIEDMKLAARQRIDEIRGDIQKMHNEVAKLTKFAKRFKSKGPDNIPAAMVQARIDGITRNIPNAEEAARLHEIALEMLGDYSFEIDTVQYGAMAPFGGGLGASFVVQRRP